MDKLVKLETFSNEFVGFVRATSESGAIGWGQVSTYNSDITCDIFHRQIAPHALGTDAFDFEDTLRLSSVNVNINIQALICVAR